MIKRTIFPFILFVINPVRLPINGIKNRQLLPGMPHQEHGGHLGLVVAGESVHNAVVAVGTRVSGCRSSGEQA